MLFEQKHQEGKVSSRSANSRKNITLSIGIRHQLKLNYELIKNKPIESEFQTGPEKLQFFSIFLPSFIIQKHQESCNFKWIKRYGIKIRNDSVIMIPSEIEPCSYLVYILLKIENEVCIVVKKLIDIEYDEHYSAFKINDIDDFE